MNWLDVICIIAIVMIVLGGLYFLISGIKDNHFIGWGTAMALSSFFLASVIATSLFLVIDKGSGVSTGKITSVDKNFFGTTALYVKTSETTQEKYCIEDAEIAQKVKKLIGEYVEVHYGERVGLYSTGKCNQAPVTKVEVRVQEKEQ